MKRLFGSLILFILGISCVNAQGINYQKSLDEALSLAAKDNKPVFVMVDAPIPQMAAPANATINYTTGLDSKDVIDFYSKKFISYKASITDSAGIKLRDKFHLTGYPAFIFLDSKGQLISKDGRNSRDVEHYMNMANTALNRLASGKTLSYYEQLHKQGTINGDQLKEYITLREELEMFDNAALIDEYVNFLTVKSFDDYNTVLFIYKAGPYAYGKAYTLIQTNKKISDSVFIHEPSTVRADINNRMITNTRNEAIKNKDAAMAQRAAGLASNSWGKNYREGLKANLSNMMTYYRAIKDTTRYFQTAINYYDNYFMNISADSAKKMQQKTLEDALARTAAKMPEAKPRPAIVNGNMVTYSASALVAVHVMDGGSQPLDVANRLNGGAYEFYTLGTHNPNYLIKALVWCRRAIELDPRSAYYDTMAHIMYRLNFYDEAILNQNKAIEMAAGESQSKTGQDKLKAELAKMRTHQL